MTENELLKSLIRQYSPSNDKIHDKTSITRDLNIQEQKAIDFIEAYSSKFNVDISAFEFDKYFSEAEELANNQTHKELTFADLTRAIKVGELNDNVIGFEENDPNLPLKFTLKNIILGTIFVLVVSAILGLIAIYI